MGDRVVIMPYDTAWPASFDAERAALAGVLGALAECIEHIGSTAVPHLSAKPIIDIMVGVGELPTASLCAGLLRDLSYEYVPEYEAFLPRRRFFRKGPPHGRTHHLHMVETRSEFWTEHLVFRDRLRGDLDLARRYEALKHELATQFGWDSNLYARAKTNFVRAVLDGG